MRVLLIAVGSRGDAEPMCSLAATLARYDEIDGVELFLQTDLESLVPQNVDKIHYHALPFTQMDFYKYAGGERKPPQAGADHPNPRVKFLGIITDIMGALVLPCYQNVMDIARGKPGNANPIDAIVGSSLARQLVLEVAMQLEQKIPVYLLQLQNLVPTKDFPHYSRTEACVDALTNGKGTNTAENLETYLELEKFQYEFLKVHADNQLATMDVADYDPKRSASVQYEPDMVSALTGHPTTAPLDVWMVNAVSTHIIPATSDAGPKVLNVGSLAADYIPKDFEPPQDLGSFLDKYKGTTGPPICFGYGSMPFGQAELLVEAVYEAKRPAILVGSAMMDVLAKKTTTEEEETDQTKVEWIKENLFCVSNIPYPWLLPRCSMMFSHGGAGVLHSTLRAGIPAVIAPFLGDQFFFAPYVEAKGWGVKVADNMMKLTKDDILRSIEKADACKEACRQLGNAMAKGEPAGSESGKFGPELLATAIIEHVGSKQ